MHQFSFENGYFFPPVWPIVNTYQVKTVTENGCFQKRSQEWRYLETPAFLLRADGRKRRFSIAMTYRVTYERDAIVFNIVLEFSCGQAKMIR